LLPSPMCSASYKSRLINLPTMSSLELNESILEKG
jgi:hypothetical protein